MAQFSVCGLAYNDEPSMRTRLESVAGCGEELVVVDFPVPIEWVLYCCGIRNLDGYGIRSVLQSATIRWKPFGDGVIFTPDVPTYVRVCVKLVHIGIVLTGLPWGRFGFVSNWMLTQRPGEGGRTPAGLV